MLGHQQIETMELKELVSNHRAGFKEKVIQKFADTHSLTREQVETEYREPVEQFVQSKYEKITGLVEKIYSYDVPVLLSIRRNRNRADKCKLCEGNEPNVVAMAEKYRGRIEILEVSEDSPEGALYHVIFSEESAEKGAEKKVPLTAIIDKGDIKKYWAGKIVDAPVYDRYIKQLLKKIV